MYLMDMDEIGRTLLEAREKLGLTLEEVERATRIRTHHLEALEKGMIDALPSPVQARGFLNNYAEFLGLDANPILLKSNSISLVISSADCAVTESKNRSCDVRMRSPTKRLIVNSNIPPITKLPISFKCEPMLYFNHYLYS